MLLEINELFVRYGKSVMALQGPSLRVAEGELVSLIGQNGAGKSTILKAIIGLVPIHSGSIHYESRSVAEKKFSGIQSGIAYVPEDRGIFSSLSVAENMMIGAVSRKDKKAVQADIAREVERFPILGKYWDRGASLLSGGEQQQLAIARGLLLRPKLLLLDEPTLGLAPIVVDLIFDVIEKLRADGVTILLVEQNAARSLEVSDRSYIMQAPGKILGSGTASELAAIEPVVEYLGFSPDRSQEGSK